MTATVDRPGGGSPASEELVVKQIAEGSATALGELYDRCGRTVYTLALRIVNDPSEAEEIVQDVFVHVWRNALRYDKGRATVTGWLLMMARSRAIDRVRARRARPGDSASNDVALTNLTDGNAGQEASAMVGQAVERLRAALLDLPATLRQAIEMAYYEGLTQSAIAARLGEPLGTVKTRMRTALSKLRLALDDELT